MCASRCLCVTLVVALTSLAACTRKDAEREDSPGSAGSGGPRAEAVATPALPLATGTPIAGSSSAPTAAPGSGRETGPLATGTPTTANGGAPTAAPGSGQEPGPGESRAATSPAGAGGGERPTTGAPASSPPEKVRPSALAGSWYEASKEELAGSVQGFLGRVEPDTLPGYPIALLAPHAGYQYSGPTAAYAYASLKGRSYARVFLLGPSHRDSFHGVALPEDTHFETPLGKVPLDTETMAALAHEELFVVRPSAHAREHSLEIQLPFLQTVLPRFRLVPLVLSDLTQAETEKVAAALRKVMGPGDLVVASSDFTHYGPRFGYLGPPSAPFGKEQAAEKLKELLEAAWAAIEKKDVEAFFKHQRETEDTICGFLPIAVLLKLLPSEAAAKLLKTDFSGRMTGDFDESVSYLSAAFCGLWPYEAVSGGGSLTDGEKADLLKLARASVDTYVKTRTKVTPGGVGVEVTPRLRQQNGAFVTLKKHGDLRGCIGTILPVKPLLDAVIDNGINAAVNDGRFEPVTEGELGEIEVEVSVLTTPTEIAGQEEFILGRHGIIIQKNGRSAVFLPQVAPEQGWTVEETLSHLSRKAGLGWDGWREGAGYQVFEAIVFHERE